MITGLFEDSRWPNLVPLTYMHPTWDLKCGTNSLYVKIKSFSDQVFLFTRDFLVNKFEKEGEIVNNVEKIDDDILLLNGRIVFNSKIWDFLKKINKNSIGLKDNVILFAFLNKNIIKDLSVNLYEPVSIDSFSNISNHLNKIKVDWMKTIEYPWDLINENPKLLREELAKDGKNLGFIEENVTIKGDINDFTLQKDSVVEGPSIVDVREGPVWIGKNTKIESFSNIKGPSFIGDNVIVYGAQIRENNHIGDTCKVGGEIEGTIMHGYSNKRHHGFLGHSYICEWVNIGAGATNSDLKNTYGNVRVNVADKRIDTGMENVGCFIGDHTKIGINTSIMTGKMIGIFSQVIGLVEDDIPSFKIFKGIKDRTLEDIYLDSVIETQKKVFERRKRIQTEEDKILINKLFSMIRNNRKNIKF